MTKSLSPVKQSVWKPPKRQPVSVLRMAWRRRVVLAVTWAAVTAVGALVVHRLPAVYRAEAVILVESQRIPERFVAPTVSSELKDRLATLSQQILSYSRLLEVVDRYELYKAKRSEKTQEEIIELMREDVQIRLDEGWMGRSKNENRPSAFRISYQGENPEVVASVANQLGSLFIDENLRSREGQALGTSQFIGTQLVEAKKKLEEQEAMLSRYKVKFNGELPEQEATLLATLGHLQARLQAENDGVIRAEQGRSILEASIAAAEDTDHAISEIVDQGATRVENGAPAADPDAENATALRRRIERAKAIWGDSHPELAAMRAALAAIEKSEGGPATPAAKMDAAPGSSVVKKHGAAVQLNELKMQRQERLRGMKAQLEVIRQQIKDSTEQRDRIAQEIAKAQQRLGRIPLREQEMAVVRRDYEISRAHYQSLLDKGMAADLAAEMERRQKAERFMMVDAARVPQKPVKPNRPLLYTAALLLGCMIGAVVAVGAEMRRDAVLDERDIPAGVPILGRIPSMVTYHRVIDIAPRRRRRTWVWVTLALAAVGSGCAAAAWYFGWIPAGLLARLHG